MRQFCKLVTACLSAGLFVACGGNNGLSSSTAIVEPQTPINGQRGEPQHSAHESPDTSKSDFRIRNAAESVLYNFAGGADGASPVSALIQANGTLYGATPYGGSYPSQCDHRGCGTVFSFAGSAEHVLHAFDGTDGLEPRASLEKIATLFYGATSYGGASGWGTVFSITASGTELVLYSFDGGANGAPFANVINAKPLARRTVYGTTAGTFQHNGSAFALIIGGGQQGRYAVLHMFSGPPDGDTPQSPLVQLNGQLYGTTSNGGYADMCAGYYSYTGPCGTLYSLTSSGQEYVKWEFGVPNHSGAPDGERPSGRLSVLNGVLYGTTVQGGNANADYIAGAGTVFSYNPYGFSHPETVLHRFDPDRSSGDGKTPYSGLILANGNFYGTTELGGAYDRGTVFEIAPSGTETILHSFDPSGTDGTAPEAGLLYYRGRLFGTTSAGGTHGFGTIFAVRP